MSEKEDLVKKENELIPQTISKYQLASDVVKKTMTELLPQIVAEKTVHQLCSLGDELIVKYAKSVSTKTNNGIAFPTCVSVNEIVCHLSPLASDPQAEIVLKQGDIVRIELGAHVDGFVSQCAHTLVIGASVQAPITGRQADAMQCVETCAQAALRLMKPGMKSSALVQTIEKICEEYKCKPIQGIFCLIQGQPLAKS
jgi:methionine aminopeptidase